MVVVNQVVEVIAAVLRNHGINKLSAHLAAARNQFGIGRRNHHNGNKSDVFSKSRIFFFVALELFFGVAFLSAINMFFFVIDVELAFHHKKSFIVTDVLAVNRVEITLAHGKVMNGIEQACFSCSVVASKAVDLGRKLKVGRGNVAKVDKGKSVEMQSVEK